VDIAGGGWFYMDAGSQRGPLARDEVASMLAAGALAPETPVWEPGMSVWQQAADVFGGVAGQPPALGSALPREQRGAPTPDERLASRATWSLILGIVSIIGIFIPLMLLAGIVGLVFGIQSLSSSKRNMAIAGIVLSCIGLLEEVAFVYVFVDVLRHGGFEQAFRS
jgi:hypothetical protein